MMMDFLVPGFLWCLLGLVFLLIELFIPVFVLVFFGFGAGITGLLAFLGFLPLLSSQIVVFIATSLLLLFLMRPRLERFNQKRIMRTLNTLVGSTGVALTDIDPGSLGKVELHGTPWNAESLTAIPRFTRVTVVMQDNLTLIVEPASSLIWR